MYILNIDVTHGTSKSGGVGMGSMDLAEPINFWRRVLIFTNIEYEYKENSCFDIKRQKFTSLKRVSNPSIRNPNATTE